MTSTQVHPTLLGEAGAEFTGEDDRYRTLLWRTWDREKPVLGWVMLNPSTADALVDDPTVRRCLGFARRDRFGGIVVANLYQLRETNPVRLLRHPIDVALGPDENAPIERLLETCRTVVAAWGSTAMGSRQVRTRAEQVGRLLTTHRDPVCLGTTKDGHPRHPLYVPASWQFSGWSQP